MVEDEILQRFFRAVLESHLYEFQVDEIQFREATCAMQRVYNSRQNMCANRSINNDYDSASYRCAYLHKYAGIHCSLVQAVLLANGGEMQQHICLANKDVHFCCLGGGSGADFVGISAAISSISEDDASSSAIYRFTTVDYMEGWFLTQNTIYNVAGSKRYGRLGEFIRSRASVSFICDDIFSPNVETIKAITCADMLTMIKFISEVPPEIAPRMLEIIFRWMKPNALLLFVDNSGGGFYEIVSHAANAHGLVETGISCRGIEYGNKVFHQEMFNMESRSTLRVTIKVWQKPKKFRHCMEYMHQGPIENQCLNSHI